MDIGLGWMIQRKKDKAAIFWHNGGTGGYKSCLAMNVDKKIAVVILSNVSSFHELNENIDKLCFSLLSSLN
jgi:CubicO group peptidase (beta-lactamase class C family)